MGELVGYIVNCLMRGDRDSPEAGGRVRDRIGLHLDGLAIELVQEPCILEGNPGRFNGQMVLTTKSHISGIDLANQPRAIKTLELLTQLLSFATGSEVALHGWKVEDGEVSSTFRSISARAHFGTPLINIRDGAAVREFIESTWNGFRRHFQSRKLHVAINYLVAAEALSLPLELQLLSVFVFFENLKSTYADSKGYNYIKGYYRKPSIGDKGTKEGAKWPFEELLEEMFKEVGMYPRLTELVKLRNEIIHSGVSKLAFETQDHIYSFCQDLGREYIARLLDFRGSITRFSDRSVISL